MAKWSFTCNDNGGKYQRFTITAGSKQDAIKKGFEKARKNASGDINSSTWKCSLIKA